MSDFIWVCFVQTINQFFNLKVPMGTGELNGLLRGFDNTFKEYTQQVVAQIGDMLFVLSSV